MPLTAAQSDAFGKFSTAQERTEGWVGLIYLHTIILPGLARRTGERDREKIYWRKTVDKSRGRWK